MNGMNQYAEADSQGKKARPVVTALLPVLNAEADIRECMNSVLSQTMKDIEVLCIDAGSTDGTLEILREYERKDTRVRVICSDRKSYGYQMNLGLDAARGEYIAIVDTDDYILPEMFEEQEAVMREHRLDFVQADFEYFLGDADRRTFTREGIFYPGSPIPYHTVFDPSEDFYAFDAKAVTRTGLYSRSFLTENRIHYNETPGMFCQDHGFRFQTLCRAHRVMTMDKPYYKARLEYPGTPVCSREKAYALCAEYDFIRNMLKKEPELERKFAPLCAKGRFICYEQTYSRIDTGFRKEFSERFAADFRELMGAGELHGELYSL